MSRRGALTVEVTVSSFSSYVAFLEGYARALVAAETKWDRARTWLRDAIRSARAEVRVRARRRRRSARSPSRFPPFASERDVSRLAQEVFALPARLAEAAGAARSSSRSTSSRRSAASTAARSSTRCARPCSISATSATCSPGSEPSLMERMLGPKRPFYKAGPVMRLEKIPADEFAAFIDARFARSGIAAGARARRRDRRSGRQPAVRRAAARARNLGRGPRRAAGAARRSTISTRRCGGCWPSSR